MTQRQYVPVLRVLSAEMEGARRCDVSVKRMITPLFRIVRSRRDELPETYLGRAVRDIATVWKDLSESFVEVDGTPIINTDHPQGHTIELIHRSLRNAGVRSIPVIPSHADPDLVDAARSITHEHSCNVAVRLYSDDLEVPAETLSKIKAWAHLWGIGTDKIDLIIDLGFIRPFFFSTLRELVVDFINQVEQSFAVSSLVLVGSSIPSEHKTIPRNELSEMLKREDHLRRFAGRGRSTAVCAGDYSAIAADYVDIPGPFSNMNAKFFYSMPGRTIACRGRSRRLERLESQYSRLAKMLVESKYFFRHDYSWGGFAACKDGGRANCRGRSNAHDRDCHLAPFDADGQADG